MTVGQLLRHRPSNCIPGLKQGRAAMLQSDAEYLESRARDIDDARMTGPLDAVEEDALREEAAQLRMTAAQFRRLVGLLAY